MVSAAADLEVIDARLLPFSYARDFFLLAQRVADGTEAGLVRLSISDQTESIAISEVSRNFGKVILLILTHEDLCAAIAQCYADNSENAAQVIDQFEGMTDIARLIQDLPEIEDLLDVADDAPVIRMINVLLTQALREGVSDIHIEPFESKSVVRFRVDGNLREIIRPQRKVHASLISRIKIMANLDIAEKRLPQDGRISLRIGGRAVDARVSTLPTAYGERAVLRLLDKGADRLKLEQLGMWHETQQLFENLISQPHGIVLVTGPTGSGKTTTLYAALSQLNDGQANILTVEDPVEYELEGVGQTQVNARIDMSFAKALRSILRQDPDVIMIGEIRDLETAQIAVQASLTGHLVLATLHTNDSVSAVTRLLDMGIEPFLLSSSLLGVVAQRLVRKLCDSCRVLVSGEWQACGCEKCGHTGYRGRIGIYELLNVDKAVGKMIHDCTSEADIRDYMRYGGMRTMHEDGLRWVQEGVTTHTELLRIIKQ